MMTASFRWAPDGLRALTLSETGKVAREALLEDQERLRLQALLKALRRARQLRLDLRWQHDRRRRPVDRGQALLQRHIRRKREADVLGGELAAVPHAIIDQRVIETREG